MMNNFSRAALLWPLVIVALLLGQHVGHAAEMRFALVIGNDEYKTGKLATPANDAGLVADALQAAGFTVTGARNLDQPTLRESFREFLGQVSAAGPDAVALVYLAGYGVQYGGENYYVPVDADLARDSDIPLQAIRISDFTQALAALPGHAIVIIDAARQNPFARGGQPLASGLALVDPMPNMAVAFNAAPGTVGPNEQGPYGAYATALTEMISAGGLGLDDIFARVRLRVSDLTQGVEVPWYVSQITVPFFFTERAADAPPPPNVMPLADVRGKPMRAFSRVEDAYAAALEIDTIEGYEQFLAAYPESPFSRRVAAMLAVRREEMIWRHCIVANTPRAYWSYLRRYPHGPHVGDAHRQLRRLAAAMEPPLDFQYVDFGVPPPPPAELVFVDRPIVIFEGPGFAPPPPPPLFFLPPRPREFVVLAPPPPPRDRFFLPAPVAVVVPAFVRPPPSVTLRPQAIPPGSPHGRPEFHVSLPGAVQSHVSPPAPAAPGPAAPISPQPHLRSGLPGAPPPAPPPSSAFVKPGAAPPSPSGVAPASIKPGRPPHPSGAVTTAIKPGPLPPHPSGPITTAIKPGPLSPSGTSPAAIKPSPPPSHPSGPITTAIKPGPLPPSGPSPAAIKPPPPPPHPTAPVTTAIKPGPLPPHPTAPITTAVKPPAPPPSPPHPAGPVAATIKPGPLPPPPPHPAGAAPTAAKPPPCPPGKTLANVNGREVCK